MTKAVHFNVRCTICKEVFKTTMLKDIQNPSIKIYASGLVTSTTIFLEENQSSLRTKDLSSFLVPVPKTPLLRRGEKLN